MCLKHPDFIHQYCMTINEINYKVKTMITNRTGKLVSKYPKTTIIVILIATFIALSYIVFEGIDSDYSEESFMTETDESRALDEIQTEYSRGTNSISILVRSPDSDVLTAVALADMLKIEQKLAADPIIILALATPGEPELSFHSVADTISQMLLISQNITTPTMTEKIDALAGVPDAQIKSLIANIFSSSTTPPEVKGAMAMMVTKDFDPGNDHFSAKGTMIRVNLNSTGMAAGHGSEDNEFTDAERKMDEIVKETDLGATKMTVMGSTIIGDQVMDAAMTSTMILIPLALILVLVILALIYRNLFDMVISLLALSFAITWVYGFGSAFGFTFNPMTVIIPVLITGLGIDYGIHITMRYREETDKGTDIEKAIRRTIKHVGMALFLTTLTTVIAFLSNLSSPMELLGEFGVLSALGIVSSFIIMVTFIPACKQTRDLRRLRKETGDDGNKSPAPTARKKSGLDLFGRIIGAGTLGAEHHPWIVILIVVIITSGAFIAALNVRTTFDFKDFLPDGLDVTKDIDFMMSEFEMPNVEGESVFVLIKSDVTEPVLLKRIDESISNMKDDQTVIVHSDRPKVQSILSLMSDWATNDTRAGVPDRYYSPEFEIMYGSIMTDGGVPRANATKADITALYDWLYSNPDSSKSAKTILHFTPGIGYDGTVLEVFVTAEETSDDDVNTMQDELQEDIEPLAGLADEYIITGNSILTKDMRDTMYSSLQWSLGITLIVCLVILTVIFWLQWRSIALGFITMIPITLCVIWIMGAMYVFDISLNVMTLMVTSLTIGLGIDYGIHITSRFLEDMKRFDTIDEALKSTVGHTGTALFGTTITTVTGFGILVFATMPPLQQFGGITALTILFSFLASVFILPTFLVMWAKIRNRRMGDDDKKAH